jgi:hypothetical protein
LVTNKRSSVHRSNVQGGIVEEREMDLPAHRGDVGLLEQELGGPPPPIALLGLIEGQHVGGRIADARTAPPLIGRGGISLLERYAAGNNDMRER